jgi:hypothetical protein
MLSRAAELAELTGERGVCIDALRNRAVLLERDGDFAAARTLLVRAIGEARHFGVVRLEALVTRSRGDVAASEWRAGGERTDDVAREEARAWHREAAELFGRGGYDLEAAESWERLARVTPVVAEAEDAREHARTLREAHRRPIPPPSAGPS